MVPQMNRPKKRIILVNLAHEWHKTKVDLEKSGKLTIQLKQQVQNAEQNIVRLLRDAEPLVRLHGPASVLEAYLFNHYLKIEFTPEHEQLSLEDFKSIQEAANYNLEQEKTLPSFNLKTVDIDGALLGVTTVRNSVFHAVTNSQLGDYVIVKFTQPVKNIPLFINHEGITYRTDIFGGSKLRGKFSDGDYGSLIAVTLRAGEFFRQWFTSEESFWYAQRAFLAHTKANASKTIHGPLKIATVPDKTKLTIRDKLIVQDGFGYIKSSKVAQLKLNNVDRMAMRDAKNVPFEALHAYECEGNRNATEELFNAAKNEYLLRRNYVTPKVQAKAFACTVPKHTAIGVPVLGKNVILSSKALWGDFVKDGVMIGKNPYSARNLQFADSNGISWLPSLEKLKVFQYSLTGFYADNTNEVVGSFFKGLLGVIPDNDWPAEYYDADIIVSSKDQKLNQSWISSDEKNSDQDKKQQIRLNGVLVIIQELHKKQLVGIPLSMAERLGTDYDGDEYDILSAINFPSVADLVRSESKTAILNPKIAKSFTPRQSAGNYARILSLRKPLLETWVSILKRFYHLDRQQRIDFAAAMAPTNLLEQWLVNGLSDDHASDLDIVVIEMQVGIKFW